MYSFMSRYARIGMPARVRPGSRGEGRATGQGTSRPPVVVGASLFGCLDKRCPVAPRREHCALGRLNYLLPTYKAESVPACRARTRAEIGRRAYAECGADGMTCANEGSGRREEGSGEYCGRGR
jgi:hypothetical protein